MRFAIWICLFTWKEKSQRTLLTTWTDLGVDAPQRRDDRPPMAARACDALVHFLSPAGSFLLLVVSGKGASIPASTQTWVEIRTRSGCVFLSIVDITLVN